MRKIITGSTLIFAGTAIHITALLVCSSFVPNINQWSPSRGKLFEAAKELHLTGFLWVSAAIFVLGLILCLTGISDNNK